MEKTTTYDCKFAEGMDVAADCKAEEQTKNQGDVHVLLLRLVAA